MKSFFSQPFFFAPFPQKSPLNLKIYPFYGLAFVSSSLSRFFFIPDDVDSGI